MSKYKIPLILLLITLSLSVVSCKKEKKPKEEQSGKFNIYIDVKDKHSLSIIKYLTDEYKNKNPDVDINISTSLMNEDKVIEDINKGNVADVLFTSRNTMIELSKKGMLNDVTSIIEKNQINKNYYSIISTYGRIQDKYYGIGIIPFSVEIFYNTGALDKLGITPPKTVEDMKNVMKNLNNKSIRIPVLLTEDVNIYDCIFSEIASNRINRNKLEKNYDSGKEAYMKLDEMQKALNDINNLVSMGIISKNTFEIGNESSINLFATGEIPILVAISYYSEMLSKPAVEVLNVYSGKLLNKSRPVIVNSVICVPINSKNEQQTNKFLEFVFSEETQKNIEKQGFITGFKKSDMESSGIKKEIKTHLENADDSSVIYIYDLPKKIKDILLVKIQNIFEGVYSSNLWEQTIDNAYK